MAAATGLARTTVFRLLSNEWPARANAQDKAAIRQALEALLEQRGASAAQLAGLWHAHGRKARPMPTVDDQPHPHPQDEEPEMLLPKQALTPMARRHFKLFCNPFEGDVLKEEQMFQGEDVRYVREAAWQCAQTGGFVAICGESGAGKTTVLTDLESRLEHDPRGVIVIKPSVLGMEQSDRKGCALKSADILHAIVSQLAPQTAMPQTLQARTVKAQKLLAASAEVGNTHLLVIEEAHSMPDATLKHLKRLHEMRNGRRPLLGILLIAQTELKTRLANGLRDGSLREVAQRCEIVELLPLDNDLGAYLACRAAAAGVRLDALIDQAGVDALRKRLTLRSRDGRGAAVSMCYPLAVNNLLTKAMNKAAELGVPIVNADVVGAV